MKKMIVLLAALVALAVPAVAGTVSYSVPVLTVRSDGEEVIPGSGKLSRCPFTFVQTTNVTPVKVSIAEDMPSGAGNGMRASLWLAVMTAAMQRNSSLSGAIISFETTGYVDGPSAGGMSCLAVMSAMEGRDFPDDFAMTGTIMADGTIGPVGGIAEKIKAAAKSGIKRICIPAFRRMEDDVDLLELGQELKLEMHQVATIDEAYRVLHRLPQRQSPRLNPAEVCRLPRSIEYAMKAEFWRLFKDSPGDVKDWNELLKMALNEYDAGQFGAAVWDMLEVLDTYAINNDGVEAFREHYPELAVELTTDAPGNRPSREQFVQALKRCHQDLKRPAKSADDGEVSTIDSNDLGRRDQSMDGNSDDSWFDDIVVSPAGFQLVSLESAVNAKKFIYDALVDYSSRPLDSIDDWNSLSIKVLNAIRDKLMFKFVNRARRNSYEKGGANWERADRFRRSLLAAMPYIRPNSNVSQVEAVACRTMIAMNGVLKETGMARDSSDLSYKVMFPKALQDHEAIMRGGDPLPAVFSAAEAIASACALLLCQEASKGNAAFFSSVISTARENALANIEACRVRGIPCVEPIMCFERAESSRDDFSKGDDPNEKRVSVLANYLESSITAKALALCFDGSKPELNAKGYCCMRTYVSTNNTERAYYLDTQGERMLCDGFAGYSRSFAADGKITYMYWRDVNGDIVRGMSTNECFTFEYNAKGELVRITDCNREWQPTPQPDGIMYTTFGYDENGNEILQEFWGATSNRVNCADGMATIKALYNERGQKVHCWYYDAEGNLVNDKDGIASIMWTYNDAGVVKSCFCFGPDGIMTLHKDGYAYWHAVFDASGRVVRRKYFDLNHKEIEIKESE